jgi:hypothetical protein
MQLISTASRASRQRSAAGGEKSRQRNDNHVGTGHIVLRVLGTDHGLADKLTRAGIPEDVLRAQFFDESGPSPKGKIPLTSRAQNDPGLRLMLGVIAESGDWRRRGFDGPHHLEESHHCGLGDTSPTAMA